MLLSRVLPRVAATSRIAGLALRVVAAPAAGAEEPELEARCWQGFSKWQKEKQEQEESVQDCSCQRIAAGSRVS